MKCFLRFIFSLVTTFGVVKGIYLSISQFRDDGCSQNQKIRDIARVPLNHCFRGAADNTSMIWRVGDSDSSMVRKGNNAALTSNLLLSDNLKVRVSTFRDSQCSHPSAAFSWVLKEKCFDVSSMKTENSTQIFQQIVLHLDGDLLPPHPVEAVNCGWRDFQLHSLAPLSEALHSGLVPSWSFDIASLPTTGTGSSLYSTPLDQVSALVSIADSLSISQWKIASVLQPDPCAPAPWFGVRCYCNPVTFNCTVTELLLSDNGMFGTLPPQIGALVDLVTLELSFN